MQAPAAPAAARSRPAHRMSASAVAASVANAMCSDTLIHRVAAAHTASMPSVATTPRTMNDCVRTQQEVREQRDERDTAHDVQNRTLCAIGRVGVLPSAAPHLTPHQHGQRHDREQHHDGHAAHRCLPSPCLAAAARADHHAHHDERMEDDRTIQRAIIIHGESCTTASRCRSSAASRICRASSR